MDLTNDISSPSSDFCPHDCNTRYWFIVIGTALGTIIEGILPHSFGTLIAHFKSASNSTLAPSFILASQFQLNWIPAVSSALPCIILPVFAKYVQKFNKLHQLYSGVGFLISALSCCLSSFATNWEILLFTHSVLYSLGTSIFLAVVIVITAEYFPVNHRFHVLATSLYQIGYPVSALVGNPLLALLLVSYRWQITIRLVAILQILFGVVIAVMMVPINNKGCCNYYDNSPKTIPFENESSALLVDLKPDSTKLIRHCLKSIQIWPWLFAKYINYMCWYGLRTNIVTYIVKSTSFDFTSSASLMSMYATAEIAVALAASLCGDKLRGWLIHIHILATILLAILTAIFPLVLKTYFSAVILMICIGMCIQMTLSFGYPASIEVWKTESDMKTGWVLTNVAGGLGIISSPLISGIFMDNFGFKFLFYSQVYGWIIQTVLYTLTLIIMNVSYKT